MYGKIRWGKQLNKHMEKKTRRGERIKQRKYQEMGMKHFIRHFSAELASRDGTQSNMYSSLLSMWKRHMVIMNMMMMRS